MIQNKRKSRNMNNKNKNKATLIQLELLDQLMKILPRNSKSQPFRRRTIKLHLMHKQLQ